MKIQLKLSCCHPDNISPLYVWETKGQVTRVNSPIQHKIELVKDSMAVLITRKSDEYIIIKNEDAIISTTFSESKGHSRADNYHANSRNWGKIKLVQDCMSVPVICKFDEDPIKIWSLSSGQHFPHYMSNGD